MQCSALCYLDSKFYVVFIIPRLSTGTGFVYPGVSRLYSIFIYFISGSLSVLLTVSLIYRTHDSSKTTVVYIILKTTSLMQKHIDNEMIFICSIKFLVPVKSIWLVTFEMPWKIKFAGI